MDLFDDLLMTPATKEEELVLAQVVQPIQDPHPSYVPGQYYLPSSPSPPASDLQSLE